MAVVMTGPSRSQRSYSKFIKDRPLLVAQQANLSHNERLDTLGLQSLARGRPGGKKPSIDIAGSLVSAEVTLTIEGASTFTLGIHDPKWELERSGLLDRDANGRLDSIGMSLDSLRFRLVQAARQDDATLTLTFEDEVWALLRAHRSHLATSRNALTRAQFVERMVHEVRLRDLVFQAPEKGHRQPVQNPDYPHVKPAGGASGFDRGTRFKIKGVTADPQQMREVATALGVADQEDVPQEGVVRLALLCAGIGESGFRDVPNAAGSPYGGVFQALKTRGMSTEEQARAFLKGGQGFQAGGAIAAHRANPSWSPGDIATHVEASGQPGSFYQAHHGEAAAIASKWNGGDGGESTHEAVRVKSYRYTRGLPGQTENTVQCATRLAEEVAWRFYAVGPVVYFVSDYYLIAQPADLVLDGFDAPGLVSRPAYEWDHRKLVATCEIDVAANAWGVLPGSCVDLDNMGPVGGRWIVQEFTFDLFDAAAAHVTLTKPTRPRKEPAPELFTVAVGDGTPATVGSGGAKKAIAWAESKIGHYKEAFGSNRGKELDALEAQAPFRMQGEPWCAIFATTALVMGGVSSEGKTAAVAQIRAWAQAGTNGYTKGFRATPQPGDLVTWDTAARSHVGLVVKVRGTSVDTIEGNTSAGQVARGTHVRGDGQYVRPDYPDEG
jgi:hypothetical protein